MFDVGWPEMLVIAIVLIVVVGPKDLPAMLRNFGRTTSKLRAMAGDFRKQFDEALKEAELDDVKGMVDDVRKLNPASDIRKALSPMEKAARDVRAGLDSAMRPAAKPQDEKDTAKGGTPASAKATPAAPLKNGHDSAAGGGTLAAATGTAGAPAKAKPAAATAKPAAAKAGAAKQAAAKSGASASAAKPKAAAKRAPAKKAGTTGKAAGKGGPVS